MDQRPHRQRYTVGAFAKLTGIPKQTLQFYDKIGIFSPAIRLENGYRYYEAEQYEVIEVIYSLKEAGLPLSDIKSYLDNRTPEMCVNLLDQESKRIREKIKSLERALKIVEQKKAFTQRGLETAVSDVVKFRYMPETHMFTWDFSEVDESGFMSELIRMSNWCYENGYYTGYALGAIISQSALNSGDFSKVGKMYMIIDHPSEHPNYRHRPAGNYAVYNYKGSYEAIPEAYPKILKSIKDNGLRLGGDSCELGLLDFFSVRESSDYLIEISIPVIE